MKRRRLLESTGAAILATGIATASTNPPVSIPPSDSRIGAASHGSVKKIDYGETKTGKVTDVENEYLIEYFGTSTEARDSVNISVQLDNHSTSYLAVYDGESETWISDGYERTDDLTLSVPATDALYLALAVPATNDNQMSYEISLDAGNNGDNSGDDLESISYGQTESSHVDSEDPTLYGSYHYEPITFSGEEGDQIKIEVTSDEFEPYVYLYKDDSYVDYQSNPPLEKTLQSDGQYTIRVFAVPESTTGSYTISLSESTNSTGGYLSMTVVDIMDNPVPDTYVAAYYQAGTNTDNDTTIEPGVQLIAEGYTDEDGVVTFDGNNDLITDSADGHPLPRDSIEEVRNKFSKGYNKGVTLVAVERVNSDEPTMTSGNRWFSATTLPGDDFFSAGFNQTMALDHQRLYTRHLDEGKTPSETIVYRKVDTNDHSNQTLYSEIRGASEDESVNDLIKNAVFSMRVPEDITVQYNDSDTGVYVPETPQDDYPFSPMEMLERGAFNKFPVPASTAVELRPPRYGERAADEAIEGAIGFIPGVGDAVAFVQTVNDVFNLNSEPVDIDETAGGESEPLPNSNDLVKGAIPRSNPVALQAVSLTVPSGESTTFVARATWHQDQSEDFTATRYHLDHTMQLSGDFTARALPGKPD